MKALVIWAKLALVLLLVCGAIHLICVELDLNSIPFMIAWVLLATAKVIAKTS